MPLIKFPQTEEEVMPDMETILHEIRNHILVPSGAPDIFQIEPTNSCNIKCKGCPRQEMKRHIGYMDHKTYSKVFEYAKMGGVVGLSGFGEPTLYRDLDKIVKMADERWMKTVLMTNGTNMDKVLDCVDEGLSAVCIDLTGIDTHPDYKGKDLNWILEDIDQFLLDAKQMLRVRLQFINISHIIGEDDFASSLDHFHTTWKKYSDSNWIEIMVKEFDNFGGSVVGPDNEGVKQVPCIVPWQSVSILWDGSIVPCCREFNGSIVFGNINTNDLASVWKSNKYIKFRRLHLSGDFPDNHMCCNCSVRGAWNGYFAPFIDLSKHFVRVGE